MNEGVFRCVEWLLFFLTTKSTTMCEKKNLLLIDDDDDELEIFTVALNELNIPHNCTCAKDPLQAIQILKGNCFDFIFLDINMPKMNGFELLENIRNSEEYRSLKCFIITTSGEQSDRKMAERLGVSGYLIKPLKLNKSSNIDMLNLTIDLMNFKSAE